MEFRLASSQNARMSRDISELQRSMAELRHEMGGLRHNADAMPEAVAELVVELLSDRDKRRS